MRFSGFWLCPDGEVVDLETKTHVMIVILNPDKYGESPESIRESYRTFKEPIGWEGQARREILTRVLRRGFVRVREQRDGWVAEQWEDSSPRSRHLLGVWANKVLRGGASASTRVRVNVLKEEEVENQVVTLEQIRQVQGVY